MGATVVLAAVSALAAAGLTYQAIGVIRDRRRFAAPGTLAPVGRHRLHYRCEGAGVPAVVLEAGIAASSLTWSRVQPAIAEITRVCSYDRAGLAWSESTSTARSIGTLVSELHALLHRAGVTPPYVLVGHSFGALIIRAFARAHPLDVAGLVFVDPLHPEEWCDPSPEQQQMLRGGVLLSRVGALLARGGIVRLSLALLSGGAPGAPRRFSRIFGRRAAALLEHMVGEVQKLPQEVLPSVQAHWSNQKAFRGMWQHLAALPACSADLMRGADAFGDMPVTVISAGERQARWLAADAALAGMSSNGRHVIAPHGGHWVHLDHPELVIAAIRDVVDAISTRTRTDPRPCTDQNNRT
jgi:pimeloyl-ACP methyl ester carboxylesterase